MKALSSEISIGDYTFKGAIGCKIEKSTRQLGNTAEIELPLSAVFENKSRLNISTKIARGEKVVIKLGYDGDLASEFTGYVTSVGSTDKTVVKCEDKAFILRYPLTNKLFKKAEASLANIIKYITSGSGLPLAQKVPDMELEGFLVKEMNAIQALQKIKDEYGISVFLTSEDKLYIGLVYTYDSGSIAFDLQRDLPEGGNKLDFKVAEEMKVKIKAVSVLKNNQRLEKETGDSDGETRTLFYHGISDESKLLELAKNEIKKYKYTGYEGSITVFGDRIVMPGMSAKITDNKYPDREGIYYVESVKTSFGDDGFRRTVELGIKL